MQISRRAWPMLILGLFFSVWCLVPEAFAGGLAPPDTKQAKPYALIFGTVWGPDDRPLYGIKVKIRRQTEKKARWEVYSDRRGEFALRVPAGKEDYVLWPDLKGFKSADGKQLEGQEVVVHVDYDERVDTGLHLK